eukprot:177557-Chlamydomonas_euryale.AAC.9
MDVWKGCAGRAAGLDKLKLGSSHQSSLAQTCVRACGGRRGCVWRELERMLGLGKRVLEHASATTTAFETVHVRKRQHANTLHV